MSFVITEPCVGFCEAACQKVCPVACIQGPIKKSDSEGSIASLPDKTGLQLYINPSECINCNACEPVCPVNAIYSEEKLPEKWKHYAEINANFFI